MPVAEHNFLNGMPKVSVNGAAKVVPYEDIYDEKNADAGDDNESHGPLHAVVDSKGKVYSVASNQEEDNSPHNEGTVVPTPLENEILQFVHKVVLILGNGIVLSKGRFVIFVLFAG